MSNAIGESIARLLEFSGAEVKRANYQGDVGPHVAKTIWAVKNKKVAATSWGEGTVPSALVAGIGSVVIAAVFAWIARRAGVT